MPKGIDVYFDKLDYKEVLEYLENYEPVYILPGDYHKSKRIYKKDFVSIESFNSIYNDKISRCYLYFKSIPYKVKMFKSIVEPGYWEIEFDESELLSMSMLQPGVNYPAASYGASNCKPL